MQRRPTPRMGRSLRDVVRQRASLHSHGVPWAGDAPMLALPLAHKRGDLARGLRCLAEGVPEYPSRQSPGVTPIFQQHLPVDDGIVNTRGEFPNAPPTGREVMHHIFGKRLHGVGIKNGHVSGHTWTEQPTIVNAEGRGGLKGQAAYRLLQGHDLLFAHPVPQEAGALPIAAVELHVCPTV